MHNEDTRTTGINRREAVALMGMAGGGLLAGCAGAGQRTADRGAGAAYAGLSARELGWSAGRREYELPPLPYSPDALEPHIDAETMRIHHGRHHAGYVSGLNTALEKLKEIREGSGDSALIKHWSREVSFHGSGHVNHALFWNMMAPPDAGGGDEPNGELAEAIERDFGSFSRFADHFKAASNAVEASGWGWLVREPIAGRLLVIQGEKQQDLMLTGVYPLLGVDVWEHAYYLKYQNRRADYVEAFMNVINWGYVGRRFGAATA